MQQSSAFLKAPEIVSWYIGLLQRLPWLGDTTQ
jgi:hypothetical protein